MITLPRPFDPVNDGLVLALAGYQREFIPAQWCDVGGPESGPKLSGHPDMEVWTLSGKESDHYLVVVDGELVEAGDMPAGPEGWAEQF